jgi:hypothetical protein
MRFKNINSCNNTQSNISEWLKAVGWRKKRQRWNLDLAKRVVNLSFSSWLSPMTKLVLCFPYFANIYIIYDQHIYIYNQWCCNWLQPLRSSAKSQECSIQISHWLGIKTDSQMPQGWIILIKPGFLAWRQVEEDSSSEGVWALKCFYQQWSTSIYL